MTTVFEKDIKCIMKFTNWGCYSGTCLNSLSWLDKTDVDLFRVLLYN